MFAWLRDLTSRERWTMLACWGGWTLDGFDQQLYSYVVPPLLPRDAAGSRPVLPEPGFTGPRGQADRAAAAAVTT
jgi:hypothetical protein